MNKTINANIGGLIFHIDEDAYRKLHDYLDALKRHFSRMEGQEEIVSDIESRIAEMLNEHLEDRKIVSLSDVDQVIERMGRPEDFEDPGTDEKQEYTRKEYTYVDKRFYRNPDDKVLGGVCGGIGAYFSVDPMWLRLAFVLAVILGLGTGVLIYIILWIIIPEARTTAEKLRMRGDPVNISNIEKKIREEADDLKERWDNFSSNEKIEGMKRRGRSFGADLRRFFQNILQALGKVLGIILILVGIGLLLSFFLALFGTSAAFSFSYPLFVHYIFTTDLQIWLSAIALTLLIAIPLLWLVIWLLLKILKVKVKSPYFHSGFGLVWVVGLFILFAVGIQLGLDFRSNGRYLEKSDLPQVTEDTIYIKLSGETGFAPMGVDELEFWNDSIVCSDIRFRILRHRDSVISMKTYYSSRGSNKEEAFLRAKKIKYNWTGTPDGITFQPSFTIGDEVWRNQKIRILLSIPEDRTVILDESMKYRIYMHENYNSPDEREKSPDIALKIVPVMDRD